MSRIFLGLILISGLFSCGGNRAKEEEGKPATVIMVPSFNADSSYATVARQVQFGPRIPNTPSHKQTGDFLIDKFKQYGAKVIVQEFEATTFDNHKLFLRNIIASYYPEKQKRILLAAHWDTRPFADSDKQNPNAKLDGANDGASGVSVMLEIARQLSTATPPQVGVDIILFDGEDWGEKEGEGRISPPDNLESWWCLGSQYWSKHKHKPNYSAFYGILLDMVGASNSRFFREGHSVEFAPKIVDKVWSTASRLGYSDRFVRQMQGSVMDDHYFVNTIANIPMIDIIPYDPTIQNFGDYHHTTKDNMAIISKETLKSVGDVLLSVIYYEE